MTGIARGVSTISLGRKFLWVLVVAGGWLGPNWLPMFFVMRTGIAVAGTLTLGALWLGIVIYLLLTGKRERRGTEQFLFAAGGFGSCTGLDPTDTVEASLTSWNRVNAVRLDRKGPQWHRLRIGYADHPAGPLRRVVLDAGVRCDADAARQIRNVLLERIAQDRHTPGQNDTGPPDR